MNNTALPMPLQCKDLNQVQIAHKTLSETCSYIKQMSEFYSYNATHLYDRRCGYLQAFKLESPSWLKYLQIRQLSHHGMEAVCALNDVCVYGKSAAEDLEDRLSQENPTEDPPETVPNDEHASGIPPALPPKAVEMPGKPELGSGDGAAEGDANAKDMNITDRQSLPPLEAGLPKVNPLRSGSLRGHKRQRAACALDISTLNFLIEMQMSWCSEYSRKFWRPFLRPQGPSLLCQQQDRLQLK